MKLSEVKKHLAALETIAFQLPNGELVPNHFHGTVRNEEVVNFQLWNADDYDHRLHPEKLIHIIELSEKVLGIEDLEIEVEYQGNTIEKFGLDFDGTNFRLTSKQTDCLAKDNCGIPAEKPKLNLSEINNEPCCSPDGNCC